MIAYKAPFSRASWAKVLPLKLAPFKAKNRLLGCILRVSVLTIGFSKNKFSNVSVDVIFYQNFSAKVKIIVKKVKKS
jgi:hypothetical protein